MNNITFSIAIPTYKSEFLREAIQSCLSQTYNDFEVVIVDDCSPHNIWDIVNEYDDSRIKYFRNEYNFGAENVIGNWNKCLDLCNCDYVICMGDDDVLLPNCLEEYSKLISKYPSLAVYHAWTQIINEKGEVIELQEKRPEIESPLSLWWHRWTYRYLQYIGDFCFKTEHLKKENGYFKLPYAWASDDITALRAAFECGGIANTQQICFSYRKNSFTISNNISNCRGKIIAIGLERHWYENLMKNVAILTYEDQIMSQLIKNSFDKYWEKKYTYYIVKDSMQSFRKLFFWIVNYKKYGVPKTAIINGIKQKIKNKIKK